MALFLLCKPIPFFAPLGQIGLGQKVFHCKKQPLTKGKFMNKLLKSMLAALALVGLGAAHSAVITFDGVADSSLTPYLTDGIGLLGHGDEFYQSGFWIDPFSNGADPVPGELVGAIVDGTDIANTCWSVACPVNNSTNFYTGLNDGVLAIGALNGNLFKVQSFDASFLGAAGDALPATSGFLRLQGVRANGTSLSQNYALPGPNGVGALNFNSYSTSGTFANTDFAQVFVFAFACPSGATTCTAFSTDKGQFALDNLTFADPVTVPEPETWLLMGLALAGAAVARRRRA
jgi:hypothetical protein